MDGTLLFFSQPANAPLVSAERGERVVLPLHILFIDYHKNDKNFNSVSGSTPIAGYCHFRTNLSGQLQ